MRTDNLIDLSLNENQYCVSPKVKNILRNFERFEPNNYCQQSILIKKLSVFHGLKQENIFVYAGSEQALIDIFSSIALNFKKTKCILMPSITWSYYDVLAKRFGVKVKRFPLKRKDTAFVFNENNIIKAIKLFKPSIILISSPNNPTGNSLTQKQINKIHAALSERQLLVIDQAYTGFSSLKPNIRKVRLLPKLVLIRSFSKYYALAGLRVGYMLAGNKAQKLLKLRKPYLGFSRLIEEAAIAALKSASYYNKIAKKIKNTRKKLFDFFIESKFFFPFLSDANFLLVKCCFPGRSCKSYHDFLLSHRIKIKYYQGALKNHVRITIGTEKQVSLLIKLTKKFIERCLL